MTGAADPRENPYVVIIGGGKVGFYLARHLMDRDYEVTVVEKNLARAEWIEHQVGTVAVMVGDGDEMAFLATTGIERAGVLIACTGDDEDNLVACQLAKGKFGVPRVIARVNNPVNVHVFTALGIDVPVSATELLMELIEAEIGAAESVRGLVVRAQGGNLVGVRLPDMSQLVGRRVADVPLPAGNLVVAVVRSADAMLARPDEVIRAGDELILYSREFDIDAVRDAVSR